MALKDELEQLESEILKNSTYRKTNKALIDIYEGDLKSHLEAHLSNLFSPEVYQELVKLLVPINVLQRIVDKLSKIYQQTVTRRVEGGSDQDSDLLVWYEDNFKINEKMNIANEFFNLTKATLVEPFLNHGKPFLRTIPNDRFFIYSNDMVDPTKPTHVTIILKESFKNEKDKVRTYITWTDSEVLIWDSDLEINFQMMDQMWEGLPQQAGINPYGKIPYVYTSNSHTLLVPKHDTDMMDLTLEIPAQISFLNYAIAYNAFSITYGIDLDDEGLKRAPNAFWAIKSDPTSDKTPQIGSIKPQVDITETLNFIQTELAFWLNTKGIKPGAMGTLSTENMASGISKMIDEMDTVEARKKQVEFFNNAEDDLWDLVFNHMHPFWSSANLIENRTRFNPNAYVEVSFTEPRPLESRADVVSALKLEHDAGYTSKKRVLKTLHPEMTDEEIDEFILEIDEERTIELPQEEEEEASQEAQGSSGTTSINDSHSHTYNIDAQGNGSTSIANGHSHEIINRAVQMADGHTHELEQKEG